MTLREDDEHLGKDDEVVDTDHDAIRKDLEEEEVLSGQLQELERKAAELEEARAQRKARAEQENQE
jgi:hypothetical protein